MEPSSTHTARCVLLALIIGLLASPAAWSASFTSTPASPLAIEDGTANPIFDDIDTSLTFGAGDTVTLVSIDLMLNHTWVGDLEIVLRSPGGVELTLMARPGNSQGEGDFGSPPGDNADLVSGNPITFDDSATDSAEDMGSVNVSAGTILTSSYYPDPTDWDSDIANLAGFIGDAAAGTWQIQVRDYNANANTGELVSWSLHIFAIPEPSTGLLLGFGLLALGGARRASRRH